ncbi:MAG: pyridoxamine 5'-phosphate oxidase [Erythrobacter sp.]
MAKSTIPVGADPYGLFDEWYAHAKESEPNDPNAMALATSTPTGAPSVRMVLLKGHGSAESDCGGFTFFTNAQSRKGLEIRANMQASLLFHWKSQRRQIRIDGALIEVSPQRADEYFHSRAYKSQVGSAASDQSRALPERRTYLDRVESIWTKHQAAGKVPRPAHWTGFTLQPRQIEFWMDRENRLHDRRLFTRTDDGRGWSDTLLYP